MKIAIAQIAPVVGDFEKNVALILEAYERACSPAPAGRGDRPGPARLLLTPELSVSGYALLDLLERPEIFSRTEAAIARIAERTRGRKTALAVGHVARNEGDRGRSARNCVSVLDDGRVVFTQSKTLLPTYDVFDEARYFEPATAHSLWETKDENGKAVKLAFAICEDLWGSDPVGGRKIYGKVPVDEYEKLGPDVLISMSASPYEFGKRERRESLHSSIAKRLSSPIVYVNQVGATDDILFDGASFALDRKGSLRGRLPAFRDSFSVYDTESGRFDPESDPIREDPGSDSEPDELEVLVRGLVRGISDYFERTGFKLGLLGLSGGIDSAVVAALSVRALGRENVFGVAMPSQYSSAGSLSDAETLARNLGIPFEVRPIKFLFSTANRELGEARGGLAPIAQENLQSRLRGIILMTLSNHYGALVLSTGNKSEIATGYCTLYGDMCGAIAPIGDLLKTRVYEVARRLNEWSKREGSIPPIPESTLVKAPSAELRPDQKDEDSLPPYSKLDPMLSDYLERGLSVDEVVRTHGDWVPEILRKIELNEYKRRQGAPVLKTSVKAFGLGRRVPIAKVWDRRVEATED